MNRFDVFMMLNNVAWFTTGGMVYEHNYPVAVFGFVVSVAINIMACVEAKK